MNNIQNILDESGINEIYDAPHDLMKLGMTEEEANKIVIDILKRDENNEGMIWTDGLERSYEDNRDGCNYGYVFTYKGEAYFFEFTYSSWDSPYYNCVYKCETVEKVISIIKKIPVGKQE